MWCLVSGIIGHECKHCGEVLPEIRNIKQVHQWIEERGALTGAEFRFLRKAWGRVPKKQPNASQ